MGKSHFSSSSSRICCNWQSQWVWCQAHYDSRCDRLLLIQQSMPALKLFTVGDSTSLFGNEFHKFAVLLKKKFSLCCCFVISLWYLKQWPLTWLLIVLKRLLLSHLSISCMILYIWMRSPLCLLSISVVRSRASSLLLYGKFLIEETNFV